MNKCQNHCILIKKMVTSRLGEKQLLPDTYQRVEYLESPNTKNSNSLTGGNKLYIDTGINYFADFEIDAQLTNSNYGGKFGGSGTAACLQRVSASQPYFSCWNSSSDYYVTNASVYTRHKIKWRENKIYVDDTFVANYTKNNYSGPFILFGAGTKVSGASYYLSWPYVRIYSCKLWNNNGALVRDFIPCYRKSDSRAGMYDAVNQGFYTWSRNLFIVGSDV